MYQEGTKKEQQKKTTQRTMGNRPPAHRREQHPWPVVCVDNVATVVFPRFLRFPWPEYFPF